MVLPATDRRGRCAAPPRPVPFRAFDAGLRPRLQGSIDPETVRSPFRRSAPKPTTVGPWPRPAVISPRSPRPARRTPTASTRCARGSKPTKPRPGRSRTRPQHQTGTRPASGGKAAPACVPSARPGRAAEVQGHRQGLAVADRRGAAQRKDPPCCFERPSDRFDGLREAGEDAGRAARHPRGDCRPAHLPELRDACVTAANARRPAGRPVRAGEGRSMRTGGPVPARAAPGGRGGSVRRCGRRRAFRRGEGSGPLRRWP